MRIANLINMLPTNDSLRPYVRMSIRLVRTSHVISYVSLTVSLCKAQANVGSLRLTR